MTNPNDFFSIAALVVIFVFCVWVLTRDDHNDFSGIP